MVKIDGRLIARYEPPYIVAEISGNHYGKIEAAIELIKAAKNAGANAVKFQCYEPGTITIDCDKDDFILKSGPWRGRKLFELYEKAYTPFSWFGDLFQIARDQGITAIASVFDKSSLVLLEGLGCPAYKIASMEIVDIPLIQMAAVTGKPVIISTGMATMNEIQEAVDEVGMKVIPLACVSGYPTPPSEFDLPKLKYLITSYGDAGISDHTLGSVVAIAATAMGACVIEKHLCLSRTDPIEDKEFSMEPNEFARMCKDVRVTWEAMQVKKPAPVIESSRELRRSLYVVQDMKAGDVFTEANVRSIRPFHGLPPRHLPKVLGQKAKIDIERGTALRMAMVL
tara:strand:- start:3097 stop:4116 length:1020 start_codon:yes stop_codon:yes gene_type:complete